MQLPLQITFRHLEPTAAMESRIRKEASKLRKFFDQITSCRVMIETPHTHHHKGKLYHVRIDIAVPQGELVVSREHHDQQAHQDVYVAIRDAFEAAQRQLEEYTGRRRSQVRNHRHQLLGG